MNKQIKTGISFTVDHIVTSEDTASAYGSGSLEVLATPAMIALMEKTSMEAIEPYLEKGEATVGTMVNIQHLKATPVGGSITFRSVLTETDGRRLVFEVTASDRSGTIGTGKHERFIIDENRFIEKLKSIQ